MAGRRGDAAVCLRWKCAPLCLCMQVEQVNWATRLGLSTIFAKAFFQSVCVCVGEQLLWGHPPESLSGKRFRPPPCPEPFSVAVCVYISPCSPPPTTSMAHPQHQTLWKKAIIIFWYIPSLNKVLFGIPYIIKYHNNTNMYMKDTHNKNKTLQGNTHNTHIQGYTQ